ncbi:MAG: nuclear transport factor 2 family protein [Candidatus Korobacteraceae bacterium]|jgi:hypothetical protein
MSTNQLNKLDSVPAWLGGMFACIDKKDFAGASKYLADDVVFEFGHYTFKGADQIINNVGGFDVQFAEYHHGIEQVWQGDGVVMFGGHLRFVLKDGSSHSTPFWNIFTMAADNPQKVVKGSALFDMSTVPPNYWPKVTD